MRDAWRHQRVPTFNQLSLVIPKTWVRYLVCSFPVGRCYSIIIYCHLLAFGVDSSEFWFNIRCFISYDGCTAIRLLLCRPTDCRLDQVGLTIRRWAGTRTLQFYQSPSGEWPRIRINETRYTRHRQLTTVPDMRGALVCWRRNRRCCQQDQSAHTEAHCAPVRASTLPTDGGLPWWSSSA